MSSALMSARRSPGVEDRRDGFKKLGAGLGVGDLAGLDHGQQRVEHAVLGRQPVGEQVHPPAHRLGGGQLFEQFASPESQALHLVLVDGVNERLAGREVAVERSDADAASRAIARIDGSSEKQTREAGNKMQVKECAQRLVEGVLVASGVQLAVI